MPLSFRFLLSAAALICLPIVSHAQQAQLVTSPALLPTDHNKPRIFLGGSIDMGNAPNWQATVIEALSDEAVVLLNPRRADWDPAWKPVASEPNFRAQVEWELEALESSDIIILYFAPGSQSPISLLEMGLYARTGKLIFLCPEGFWRKGNVDITVAAYGIQQVHSLDALIAEIRKRLASHRAK